MTALDQLIEAVGAGSWDQSAAWRAIGIGETGKAERAFNGSLNAALSLHEALLPGWGCATAFDYFTGLCRSQARVSRMGRNHTACIDDPLVPRPARALLLAILRAYRQQVQP